MRHHIALLIGYDGTAFYGSAPQPELCTVHGVIHRQLVRGLPEKAHDRVELQASSRTDRGVSALGNVWVVSFDAGTGFPVDHLPHLVNRAPEPVWCFGVARVPAQFRPRRASQRWYRYQLPRQYNSAAAVGEAAALFIGSHDFSTFCKRDRRRTVPTHRTIERIEVVDLDRPAALALDFFAPSFCWQQLRRIVGTVASLLDGRFGVETVRAALQGDGDIDARPAPPEPLVLMRVEYDPPLVFDRSELTPHPDVLDPIRQMIETLGARTRLAQAALARLEGAAGRNGGERLDRRKDHGQ